jgi:hypothetical protein
MCVLIYNNKCNMQCLNNCFSKLKVNDLIHVKMLIVQKMWKISLSDSSIITKYWVTCVLVYYNKSKMKFVTNGFNIWKNILQFWNWKDVEKISNSLQY